MFKGEIVWRGVVYALLMMIGKVITGLWLVRFSSSTGLSKVVSIITGPLSYMALFCASSRRPPVKNWKSKPCGETSPSISAAVTTPENKQTPSDQDETAEHQNKERNTPAQQQQSATASPKFRTPLSLPPKPKSLYPPAILGLAMVARGEIGYLIASLAESQGMFSHGSSSSGPSETYLVIIWAISLCTLVGPISVGTLVRRVKKLQQSRLDSGGPDPLGVWGI